MSLWAQQSCHSQKTMFASGASWPLATPVFLPPPSRMVPKPWEKRYDTDVLFAAERWTAPVPCTLTSWPHTALHIYLFQKGHCNLFPGEIEFPWHQGGNVIFTRKTWQTKHIGSSGKTATLPSHYRPQSTLPSQNVDLIHRQRKWFLHVPKGQVLPNATANLATHSLRKVVFPRGENGPFASLLRILKFGRSFFFFFS